MTVLAFDTHAFVKELRAAGFSETQAEAVTSVVRRTREIETAELATKADLAHLATRENLAETKADILKWFLGTIGLQTVVLAAINGAAKFLPAPH